MDVYRNPANGRWMTVAEVTDIWGEKALEVRWGGAMKRSRVKALHPVADTEEKERRRELIARRRLNHGYLRVVRSD